MDLRRINFEHLLYAAAILLAVILRFYQLDLHPLPDYEAAYALRALDLTAGEQSLPPEPGIGLEGANLSLYNGLSSLTFAFAGSSNALARFWPALAGCLLVFSPWFFRRRIGSIASLVMAFGLAVDPGMVTVSRQAGSPMLALCCLVFLVGFYQSRKPLLTGIAAGLAALSGPAVVSGTLILAAGWLAQRLVTARQADQPSPQGFSSREWLHLLLAGGGTIVLVGTGFFRHPGELATWLGAIPDWLAGWSTPSAVPAARLVAVMIFFESLVVLFSLLASLSTLWKKNLQELLPFISLSAAATLVILLYPARQVSDLVWLIYPLWILSSLALAEFLPARPIDRLALIQTAIVVLLLSLFWYTLTGLGRILEFPGQSSMQIFLLSGILALIGLATAMLALGWSWQAARDGLVWGVVIVLVLHGFSVMWNASQYRAGQPQTLWGSMPASDQAPLLVATLEQLSNWDTGFDDSVEITSSVAAPSMRWVLRDYANVRYVPALSGESVSPLLISRESEIPELSTSYRGQDFTWWVSPGWTGILPGNLPAWLTRYQAPVSAEKVILWARNDLFPGNPADNSGGEPAFEIEE